MNQAVPLMTLDEFLPWAQAQPRESGKLELLDGVVIVQQSQRWAHSETKLEVAIALRKAIEQAGVAYFAATEGPTVRIAPKTGFEPDALVAPLPKPAPDSLEITNPILVVEVLSPSTTRLDMTLKLKGYFEVASIQHYLIVDPEGAMVTHHRRAASGVIETRVIDDRSTLLIDPPGFVLPLAGLFATPSV
jgi:Uma2 family endonuclease